MPIHRPPVQARHALTARSARGSSLRFGNTGQHAAQLSSSWLPELTNAVGVQPRTSCWRNPAPLLSKITCPEDAKVIAQDPHGTSRRQPTNSSFKYHRKTPVGILYVFRALAIDEGSTDHLALTSTIDFTYTLTKRTPHEYRKPKVAIIGLGFAEFIPIYQRASQC